MIDLPNITLNDVVIGLLVITYFIGLAGGSMVFRHLRR